MRRWIMFAGLAVGATASVAAAVSIGRGVREIRPATVPAVATEISEAVPEPGDWPGWRGDGSGIATAADGAIASSGETVRWRTPVPGRGHASPVVCRGRVFLFTCVEADASFRLVCLDAESGRPLWDAEVHRGGLMTKHDRNSHASATPCCDGERVFCTFAAGDELHVVAIGFAGKVVWSKSAGPYRSNWGYGSSPAISGPNVIVLGDSKGPRLDRLFGTSFLAALDRRTGEVVWRIKREPGDSFGTPVVATLAGRPQVVAAGKKWITSYDPATGDELWRCGWSADRAANTVTFDETRVFASATIDDRQLVCVRADGAGDVTASHLEWRQTQQIPDVPSPLLAGGRLYTVTDNGVLCGRDPATGDIVWKRRVGGDVAASPVLAGDRLLTATDAGAVVAFRAGDEPAENARWDAGEPISASPAVVGGAVYVRTEKAAVRLGGEGEPLAGRPTAAK